MSAYRKPKKTCPVTGKISYPSQQAAENAAVMYRFRLGNPSRPYICSHCGCWHLTTHPRHTKDRMTVCNK